VGGDWEPEFTLLIVGLEDRFVPTTGASW
jgi:hypothetical protein